MDEFLDLKEDLQDLKNLCESKAELESLNSRLEEAKANFCQKELLWRKANGRSTDQDGLAPVESCVKSIDAARRWKLDLESRRHRNLSLANTVLPHIERSSDSTRSSGSTAKFGITRVSGLPTVSNLGQERYLLTDEASGQRNERKDSADHNRQQLKSESQ